MPHGRRTGWREQSDFEKRRDQHRGERTFCKRGDLNVEVRLAGLNLGR